MLFVKLMGALELAQILDCFNIVTNDFEHVHGQFSEAQALVRRLKYSPRNGDSKLKLNGGEIARLFGDPENDFN